MPFPKNVLEMLQMEEGFRAHAYKDSLGYLTIGYGRLCDPAKPGSGLRKEEAAYLLQNDVYSIAAQLDATIPWWLKLSEPRKAVLIGMALQMGVTGLLGFRSTLAAVEDGRYADAHAGMLNSKWATQTPRRAARMALQMLTGEWAEQEGSL